MPSKLTQRAGLALLYMLSLLAGITVGVQSHGRIPPTPMAQLGFALGQAELKGTADAHQRLADAAEAVRTEWNGRRDVLDLVLTVRGIGTGGNTDLGQAARQCTALGWPRCDEPSMQQLQERARP